MALRELEEGIRQLQLRVSDLLLRASLAELAAPAGVVQAFAGDAAPAGWLLCNGAAVSRADYPQLFAAVGTTYGAGNGSSTFNLPDLDGRTIVGRDPAVPAFDALGEAGGELTHTHTTPGHTHGLAAGYARIVGSGAYIFNDAVTTPLWTGDSRSAAATAAFSQTGLGGATALGGSTDTGGASSTGSESSLQPYLVLNFIIKAT